MNERGPSPGFVVVDLEGGPADGSRIQLSARQWLPSTDVVLVAMHHGRATPLDPPHTDEEVLNEIHALGVAWTRYVRVSAEPLHGAFRYVADPLDADS